MSICVLHNTTQRGDQPFAPGLQECRVYKIPTDRKLNFAAFVPGVFQFSVQEFVKILLWVSDSII